MKLARRTYFIVMLGRSDRCVSYVRRDIRPFTDLLHGGGSITSLSLLLFVFTSEKTWDCFGRLFLWSTLNPILSLSPALHLESRGVLMQADEASPRFFKFANRRH